MRVFFNFDHYLQSGRKTSLSGTWKPSCDSRINRSGKRAKSAPKGGHTEDSRIWRRCAGRSGWRGSQLQHPCEESPSGQEAYECVGCWRIVAGSAETISWRRTSRDKGNMDWVYELIYPADLPGAPRVILWVKFSL